MSGWLTIGPNDFVRGPYIKCPSCGEERLGVLVTGPRIAIRRCTNCQSKFTRALPNLNRQIVFLDQSAISNMMRALHPKLGREGPHSNFWRAMFLKLDRLVFSQKIACPFTSVHERESVMDSRMVSGLLRMLRHLSAGVQFAERHSIELQQIIDAGAAWIRGNPITFQTASARIALEGDPTAWADTRFEVRVRWSTEDIAVARALRDETDRKIAALFTEQLDQPESFDDRFRREARGLGKYVIGLEGRRAQRIVDTQAGRVRSSDEGELPPETASPWWVLVAAFQRLGVESNASMLKAVEFLQSDALLHVPYNRLSAMLWAALARDVQARREMTRRRQAEAGTAPVASEGPGDRVAAPYRGAVHDFTAIATSLPYCSAMLVDNKCAEYLGQEPLVSEVARYGCRIFSLRSKEKLLAYLDEVEASTTEEHRQLVEQLYGPMPTAPTLTFDDDQPGDSSAAGALDAHA